MKYVAFGLLCLVPFSISFSGEEETGESFFYPAPSKSPYPYGPHRDKESSPALPKEEKLPHALRFEIKHREANGIGYNQGYSSLDGFFLFSSQGNWYPFFDVRAHVFNNGRPAANLGFGLRYLPEGVDAVFGVNGFFDYKNTSHSTFEQVGGGIEIAGTVWAFRANGYFPIFERNNLYNLDFYKFQGHHALFRASHEIAFTGFDASLNRILVSKRRWGMDATLDGYMFFADYNKKAEGGLLKIKSDLFGFFSLEGLASYDTYFKGILQLQAAATWPFGKRVSIGQKNRSKRSKRLLAHRLVDQVDRFEMIVSTKHPIDSIAKDPRTGQTLEIIFVNNQGPSEGNGTAEKPFISLAAAEAASDPWNMIYVYSGNGSAFGMSSGIVLQEGQWLQASRLPFPVLTSFGPLYVPKQTDLIPNITNFTGPAVTLASRTIVNGFNLLSPVTNIAGNNIETLQITNNNLSRASNYDILLNDVSGDITLFNNTSLSPEGLFLRTHYDTRLVLETNNFANTGTVNATIAFVGDSTSTVILRKRNEFHDSMEGSVISVENTASVLCGVKQNIFSAIPDGAPYCLKIAAKDTGSVTAVADQNFFLSSAPGLLLDVSDAATANWYVINNTGNYTGHFSPIYPFAFITQDNSVATLLLAANSAAANGYALDNASVTATFNAESPTLDLSGLEALNTGSFATSGTITYIPYDPEHIPVIE